MEKHIVICDRCGKEAKMKITILNLSWFFNRAKLPLYTRPKNWKAYVSKKVFCPKCNNEYIKHQKEFN